MKVDRTTKLIIFTGIPAALLILGTGYWLGKRFGEDAVSLYFLGGAILFWIVETASFCRTERRWPTHLLGPAQPWNGVSAPTHCPHCGHGFSPRTMRMMYECRVRCSSCGTSIKFYIPKLPILGLLICGLLGWHWLQQFPDTSHRLRLTFQLSLVLLLSLALVWRAVRGLKWEIRNRPK